MPTPGGWRSRPSPPGLRGDGPTCALRREQRTPTIAYIIGETDDEPFELRSFFPDLAEANSFTFIYTPMREEPFDLRGLVKLNLNSDGPISAFCGA